MNINLFKTQQHLECLKEKYDKSGNIILDGNVLLGNITCISKARLGDYITDLSPSEMQAIDKAISLSLDINHYYHTLQNMYNDKIEYIKKLKVLYASLQATTNSLQQKLNSFQHLLNIYHFTDIDALSTYLKNNRKDI